MRNRIYEIVEKAKEGDLISKLYDLLMLLIIFISIIPIMVKNTNDTLIIIDYVCAYIFIVDYFLRWLTADKKFGSKKAFVFYPCTAFAIIDLLAILPTFGVISKFFRIFKLLRVIKVVRVFKALRYSKHFYMIIRVIKNSLDTLAALLVCSIFYIFISALFIFSIEPENFNNFFEALYWATTALTTVGYGDIYPITTGGKIISMISSFLGIAMVALPSGVITAEFISEMGKEDDRNNNISQDEV